jgi:hypothetical protein
MHPATSPALEQAIARLEMQLARLKKDQTLLQNLAARKTELEKELQRVNDHISRLTSEAASFPATETGRAAKPRSTAKASTHTAKAAQAPAKTPAKKSAHPTTASADKPRLADLIMACLEQAKGRPLTVRQLTDETLKRGFVTASNSPYKVVESRIQDLSKKGLLCRAKGQPGWLLLGKAGSAGAAAAMKHAAKPTVDGAKASSSADKPPLRQHVLDALQHSKRPLSLKELCQCILAAGYRTASTDFANVLGVALKKMSNIQRIPGQGYMLKGGKA